MKTNAYALIAMISAAGLAHAGPSNTVSGDIVVQEGDIVDGSAVTGVGSPFTNGNGEVGAVLILADGRRAIWYGAGAIFTSDMALPDNLTGGESTMGIGNNGEFIYSPSFNGNDSVWGQNGLILAEPDQAPGYGPGFDITFNSRPQMIDDGSGYWIGGINDGAGGTSTIERAMFRSNPNGTIDRVLGAGDVIGNSGGLSINIGSGVDFDYHVSGNGANMINMLTSDSGSSTNDGVIAVNGDIALREGSMLDGFTLGSSVDGLSINNLNQSVFIWDTVEATETLFFANDTMDFASAIAFLSVGDQFDENNDGIGDWIIDDFNASGTIGPGLDFAEDGLVYVEVDLESLDGSTNIEAIISVAVPTPGTGMLLALAGLAGTRRRRN